MRALFKIFFHFVETRDLHLHGTSCHFLPGRGVLAALSSRYQRSSWCCTDTSFPLFPKGTGELCWAVWDEIKGKSPTWHFIISCHHWRAASEPLDELGLGCLDKLDRETGTKGGGRCRDKLRRSLGCATGKRKSGYEMQALNPCFTACKRHPWAKPSLPLDMLIILVQSVKGDLWGKPQDQPCCLPSLALGTGWANLRDISCPACMGHFAWDVWKGLEVRRLVEPTPLRNASPYIVDVTLDLLKNKLSSKQGKGYWSC